MKKRKAPTLRPMFAETPVFSKPSAWGIWRQYPEGHGEFVFFISGFFPWAPTKAAAEAMIREYKRIWFSEIDGATYEARELK